MNNDKEKILIYYDDGQLYQEFYTVNKKLNGVRTWYYKSGKVKQIGNYKDDKCDGEFINYYQNGEIKSITNYQNGNILGTKNFNIGIIDKTKISIQNSNKKIINASKQMSTKAYNETNRIKREKLNQKNLKNILTTITDFIIQNKKSIKIITVVMIIALCSLHFNIYEKIKYHKNVVIKSFKNDKEENFYDKLIDFKDEKVAYIKEKLTKEEDSSKKTREIKEESFYDKLIDFKDKKIAYIKEKLTKEESPSKNINKIKKDNSSKKITKSATVTKKNVEKINIKEEKKSLRENTKTKTQITTQMKKDNFEKLSQMLKKPTYKDYILNIGAGYKISLPNEIYTNIKHNKKDKSIKFSTKYNEMSIILKRISLKDIDFKEFHRREVIISAGKMNVLNSDLSKTKYHISGKKNKTGIYKYAYYNKVKSEVVLIDFYYPLSMEKGMKKIIKTVLGKFKKK